MTAYDVTNLIQTLKRQSINEAISEALDAVYEKVSVFDGYDAEGYLGYYKSEMKNRGVPEDHMIEAFAELVDPELKEAIQKIAKDFAKNWAKFAKATISEGLEFMEEQYGLKECASEDKDANHMTQEFLQTASVQELGLIEFATWTIV